MYFEMKLNVFILRGEKFYTIFSPQTLICINTQSVNQLSWFCSVSLLFLKGSL